MKQLNIKRFCLLLAIFAFCLSLFATTSMYFIRKSQYNDLNELHTQKEILTENFFVLEEMNNHSMVITEDGYEVTLKTGDVSLTCLFDKEHNLKQAKAHGSLLHEHNYITILVIINVFIVIMCCCIAYLFYLLNTTKHNAILRTN